MPEMPDPNDISDELNYWWTKMLHPGDAKKFNDLGQQTAANRDTYDTILGENGFQYKDNNYYPHGARDLFQPLNGKTSLINEMVQFINPNNGEYGRIFDNPKFGERRVGRVRQWPEHTPDYVMNSIGKVKKSMKKANNPIDPENPYRKKSPYRQMDNDPKTSRDAGATYRTLNQLGELLTGINRLGYSPLRLNFNPIGSPKTGFHVAAGWNNGHPFDAPFYGSKPTIEEIKGFNPYKPNGGKHSGVTKRAKKEPLCDCGEPISQCKCSGHNHSTIKKNDMCKCGSGMMKSMCKCGGMSKSMLKSDMCKCGSGMMKSMCKCGGMGKSMYKAKSTGPIDPDNPYRRKSTQRQMDNDPETSRNARNSYASLDAIERELSGWQKEAFPNTKMTINFDVVGTPKTGFLIPTGEGAKGNMRITSSGSPDKPYSSRGSAARKRMYKADDKNKNTDWASKLSGAAVDFVLQNKSVIERKAKELSDQGFRYVDQNKSKIGRGARNLTEQGIDFLSANKSNVERGAKNLSDKGFDYVRRNKPNIEGIDYILDNKANIERGAKDISDKAFDYARRNKSGIGQSVERMTNQGIDYAIRSKPAIEREAKRYSDQGFDYLRRSKNEIGRQARGLVSNVLGSSTTKRAGAMSKSLQTKKKNNKYF